jgi:hypothetical protein
VRVTVCVRACVRVCVCVGVRARVRATERGTEGEGETRKERVEKGNLDRFRIMIVDSERKHCGKTHVVSRWRKLHSIQMEETVA